jgi:serine/threonine protein phosphatase 1
MQLFIIGDVHGCFHTFLKLLEKWNPKKEYLIQVGDLIDRGHFSPLVLKLSYDIKFSFKDQSVFLKGNHEQLMIDYLNGKDPRKVWEFNGGADTLLQFEKEGVDPKFYLKWLENLPLYWENESVLISHAGVSEKVNDSNYLEDQHGLLWNRDPLRNLGKLQVIGHTPRMDGQPEFTPSSNSWNIDTGAYRSICLTALRLDEKGHFQEFISVPTDNRDAPI